MLPYSTGCDVRLGAGANRIDTGEAPDRPSTIYTYVQDAGSSADRGAINTSSGRASSIVAWKRAREM